MLDIACLLLLCLQSKPGARLLLNLLKSVKGLQQLRNPTDEVILSGGKISVIQYEEDTAGMTMSGR